MFMPLRSNPLERFHQKESVVLLWLAARHALASPRVNNPVASFQTAEALPSK
jgi:hypothetical protein